MSKLIDQLKSEWPATYSLQPKTQGERLCVIEIQQLKKDAVKEIERLIGLIEEHNSDCPLQWRIEVNNV